MKAWIKMVEKITDDWLKDLKSEPKEKCKHKDGAGDPYRCYDGYKYCPECGGKL